MRRRYHIKQRDQSDCGPACLAAIAAFHRRPAAVSHIRQYAGTDQQGTNLKGMLVAADRIGFQAKAVKGQRESLSLIPLPAIAHVQLPNGLLHYMVLTNTSPKQVSLMDPALGKIVQYRREAFFAIWTGVLILLLPAEHFTVAEKSTSTLARFYHLLLPHRKVWIMCFLGALVYTLLGLLTSVYIQQLIDNVLVESDHGLLNLMSMAMLLLLGFQIYLGVFKTLLGVQVSQQIDARLILGYYRHLLAMPQSFFDTMRVGELLSRINDAMRIRHFISDVVLDMLVNLLILVSSFLLMFVYSVPLALLMLSVLPFYTLLYYLNNSMNKYWQRKVMEDASELETGVVQSLHAATTIRKFRYARVMTEKTEHRFIRLMQSLYQMTIRNIAIGTGTDAVTRLFTLLVLWMGAGLVMDRTLTAGTLMSFYAIIGYFTGPVQVLMGANKSMQEALIASDRLFDIMDLSLEPDVPGIPMDHTFFRGDIVFQEVTFSYGPRARLFQQLSFTIQAQSCIGIAGTSGSGKSTIFSLLLKLYPLESGTILIGGHDLGLISHAMIRDQISIVPQETDLFEGTLLDNICMGREPNLDKLKEVATYSGVEAFVHALPKGYHTNIGERATALSGGQKQRLAIARALYREPAILLLDEATASLDGLSEGLIQSAVQWYRKKGKTIIIIAHRLATLRCCDQILVMDGGAVVAQGSHEQLIQQPGLYQQMWQQL